LNTVTTIYLEEPQMKSPALMFALALSFTLPAFAGGPGTPALGKQQQQDEIFEDEEVREEARPRGFRASMSRLKHKLTHTDHSERGEDLHVRDGIRNGLSRARRNLTHTDHSEPGEDFHVRDTISNTWRSRPRAGDYISIERTRDGKVDIVYCDVGIKRFIQRKGCVKLNKNALKPADLKSCLAASGDNYRPGERINKHLEKLYDTDMGYRNFHLLADRGAYREYVQGCEAYLAKRTPARAAPPRPAKRPAAPVKPVPEFEPFVEQPAAPAPAEEGGTL